MVSQAEKVNNDEENNEVTKLVENPRQLAVNEWLAGNFSGPRVDILYISVKNWWIQVNCI